MRRIVRRKLSDAALAYLDAQSQKIINERPGKRKALAKKLWRQAKKTSAFNEIGRKLLKMATGLRRCMYCEDSRGAAIDHFWPLSRYPKRSFTWQNYLYACTYCNSNQKRDQFPIEPLTRRPLLIKPTSDEPRDHLVFLPSTGKFDARRGSAKGGPTIKVFGLNVRPELLKGRYDTFVALQSLLVDYAEQKRKGSDVEAAKLKQAVQRHPFSGVFVYLLEIAGGPGSVMLRADCLAALKAHPEIRGWI